MQRGRNQMLVIQGIVNKAASPAILKSYQDVLAAASDSIATNMPKEDIISPGEDAATGYVRLEHHYIRPCRRKTAPTIATVWEMTPGTPWSCPMNGWSPLPRT